MSADDAQGFTAAIEAAFANYESARQGKVALPPPRFEAGKLTLHFTAVAQDGFKLPASVIVRD